MNLTGVREMNEEVEKEALFLRDLLAEIRKAVVGQDTLVERVLIGLLADGHVLLEGVPGLAKTLLVTSLAQTGQARFSRVQFTPDLLPADLIGTQIYNPRTNEFSVHQGPIFANLVLADEVNRAPQRSRVPCWRLCKSARSPLVTRPFLWKDSSSYLPRRIR